RWLNLLVTTRRRWRRLFRKQRRIHVCAGIREASSLMSRHNGSIRVTAVIVMNHFSKLRIPMLCSPLISAPFWLAFFILALQPQTIGAQGQIAEPKKLLGVMNEESSWSPDGKSVAFDSSRPGKTSIFTWRLDTRELNRMTS